MELNLIVTLDRAGGPIRTEAEVFTILSLDIEQQQVFVQSNEDEDTAMYVITGVRRVD
jgi:hypothetical protein